MMEVHRSAQMSSVIDVSAGPRCPEAYRRDWC